MRFAGNFHPEWGYLAPAPNFMRTARVVAVATAIGATAGAAVVLSLAERSAPGPMADAGKTLVVVHSLVQPAEAAAPAAAPVAAATPTPVIAPVVTAAPVAPAKVQASAAPRMPAVPPVNPQISAPPVTGIAPPPATAQVAAPAPSDSRTVSAFQGLTSIPNRSMTLLRSAVAARWSRRIPSTLPKTAGFPASTSAINSPATGFTNSPLARITDSRSVARFPTF